MEDFRTALAPQLPPHCVPANDFLFKLSSTFHTCVPSTLALISTILGCLSIASWLFAQLPQIWKNYQLGSTSGLSIFFLGEWLLGDASNMLGSIFTRQALWQVVIATYYCLVDCVLVGQWLWYELLKHGRPLRSDIPTLQVDVQHSKPREVFRTPQFSSSPASSREGGMGTSMNTPQHRNLLRIAGNSSPTPSPRTVLYVAMILAVVARASPVPSSATPPEIVDSGTAPGSTQENAGRILSWLSTLMYLGSRMPQLIKNHLRRSTSGLSPTLFAAAFFGNLFYSSSLLTNPCAWNDFGPYGGGGWADANGSSRVEWIGRAAPFWLGAAGVLVMDAAVGVQFWYFGEGAEGTRAEAKTVVVGQPNGKRWRWRRVSGWMRGWNWAYLTHGVLRDLR
ncbi:PQ loop repeat-domain-containing protein [Lineolata rhizophorae]|uniref:PQ loop repeat-domain-containing protein n=1 Tax=Lineolata rhizophorae TaxID=578093 RepID=A0A6A6PE08_9PEZI|nr:PQ loop repeat-domain-containing protein [Lineolata rhizophorae]